MQNSKLMELKNLRKQIDKKIQGILDNQLTTKNIIVKEYGDGFSISYLTKAGTSDLYKYRVVKAAQYTSISKVEEHLKALVDDALKLLAMIDNLYIQDSEVDDFMQAICEQLESEEE